ASKPRTQRRFELPPPEAGEARLNVATRRWKTVRIDDREPVPAPAWDLGVSPGAHVVEFIDAKGGLKSTTVNVAAGETKTVTLD
ncbi:MAG: hypothetical protein AAF658_10130, partial [Myxococcota bacterium]